MNAGIADQVGTLNTLEATVKDAATGRISINGILTTLPAPLTSGAAIGLALRPESVHLTQRTEADITLPATITSVHFMGSVIRVQATAAGRPMALDTFNHPDSPPPLIGAEVNLSFHPRDLIVLQG